MRTSYRGINLDDSSDSSTTEATQITAGTYSNAPERQPKEALSRRHESAASKVQHIEPLSVGLFPIRLALVVLHAESREQTLGFLVSVRLAAPLSVSCPSHPVQRCAAANALAGAKKRLIMRDQQFRLFNSSLFIFN